MQGKNILWGLGNVLWKYAGKILTFFEDFEGDSWSPQLFPTDSISDDWASQVFPTDPIGDD